MGIERFKDWSKKQVLDKHGEIGYYEGEEAFLNSTQNLSPTVRDLLNLAEEQDGLVGFDGYVVHRPRSDFRVRVDGFSVRGLDARKLGRLLIRFYEANDISIERDAMGFSARFWWD